MATSCEVVDEEDALESYLTSVSISISVPLFSFYQIFVLVGEPEGEVVRICGEYHLSSS